MISAGHLPRERFVSVLLRLASSGGVLVGNSSAGLIEAAVLGVPAVNVGARQTGRERAGNVVEAQRELVTDVRAAVARAGVGPAGARSPVRGRPDGGAGGGAAGFGGPVPVGSDAQVLRVLADALRAILGPLGDREKVGVVAGRCEGAALSNPEHSA
ncbi:MAG: hypothetical protein HND58_00670 [Planctomycetota bacterium]|nr:MAG: hypothetical protein HND58_00670 [Planctomycetota bacterium]